MTARITDAEREERLRARRLVGRAIHRGRIPSPRTLRCVECDKPALSYHHHRGYALEHALDVEPLCSTCHALHHTKPETLLKAQLGPMPLGRIGWVRDLLDFRGQEWEWFLHSAGLNSTEFIAIESGQQMGSQDYYETAARLLDIPVENITPPEVAWWQWQLLEAA